MFFFLSYWEIIDVILYDYRQKKSKTEGEKKKNDNKKEKDNKACSW